MTPKNHVLKVAVTLCMLAVALCAPLENTISEVLARRKELISLKYQTSLESCAYYKDIETQIDYNLMRIRNLEKAEIKEYAKIKKRVQEETADIKDELFRIMIKMDDAKKGTGKMTKAYNSMKISVLARNSYIVPCRILDEFIRMKRNEIICDEQKVREVLYTAAPILKSIDGPETFIQNLIKQGHACPDLSVVEILENNLHYLLPAHMQNKEKIVAFLSQAYTNPEVSENLKCELADIQRHPLRLECDHNENSCCINDMEDPAKEGTLEWMLDVLMAEYIMNNGRFQGVSKLLVALQRVVVQDGCPGKERIGHLISTLRYNTDIGNKNISANQIGRHISGLPTSYKNKLVTCEYCRNADLIPYIQGEYRDIVLDMLNELTLVVSIENDGMGVMWTYFENYHYIWYRIKKYSVEIERVDDYNGASIKLNVCTKLPSITRAWATSLITLNQLMHEYKTIIVTESKVLPTRNGYIKDRRR